jgi:hypothetical protein
VALDFIGSVRASWTGTRRRVENSYLSYLSYLAWRVAPWTIGGEGGPTMMQVFYEPRVQALRGHLAGKYALDVVLWMRSGPTLEQTQLHVSGSLFETETAAQRFASRWAKGRGYRRRNRTGK